MKEMPKPWFQKYFYAKTTTVCASSVTYFQEQFQTPANTENTEVVNSRLWEYSNQLTFCIVKEKNAEVSIPFSGIFKVARDAYVTCWQAVSVPIMEWICSIHR